MSLISSITQSITSSCATTQERDADALLVEQVKAGDVAAFDSLVVKYRQRLYSVIYNLTSNREDASDLTQDTFIKAFRSIKRFKGKSSFFTWIYRIALNTSYSHLKKNRFSRYFSFEKPGESWSDQNFLDTLASDQTADKPTLINELQEKLNEALQMLSIEHRSVVVLYEIEGLSHQEIADITKTNAGTVRSRLYYAKQQLQSYLKEYVQS